MRPTSLLLGVVTAALVLGGCGGAGPDQVRSRAPRPRPLALTRSSGPAAGPAIGAPFSIRPTVYTLGAPLPDLGSSAPVYRLVAARTPRDAAATIASALRLAGVVRDVDHGAQVTDGTRTLNVFAGSTGLEVSMFLGSPAASAGGVGVASVSVSGSAPASVVPAALPSAAEAQRIARRVVDDAHLLDGDGWDTEVTAGAGVVSAVACRVGVPCPAPPPPVVTSRIVVFHRRVDGRRASGLDWSVQIGDHGVVQSLSGTWAKLELVAQYPLRSVNDVSRDLVNGRAWYGQPVPLAAPTVAIAPGSHPEPVHVTVTGVRLGAMVMPAYEASTPAAYVVPTYRFEGTYATGEQWNAEVLALPPPMIATPKPFKPTPAPVPVPGRTDG